MFCQSCIFAIACWPKLFKMKFLKISLLLLFCAFPGYGQGSIAETLEKFNEESVPYITVHALAEAKNLMVLDAWEKKEFHISHLEHAVWVGYTDFDPKRVLNKIKDKNTALVVYCSVGVRSENIAEKLIALGYTDVKNLYGGIFEWKNQGHPVFDTMGKKTPKVHAYSKQWGKLLTKGDKVYE